MSQIILKILSEKEKEETMGFNKLYRKTIDLLYPNKTNEERGFSFTVSPF